MEVFYDHQTWKLRVAIHIEIHVSMALTTIITCLAILHTVVKDDKASKIGLACLASSPFQSLLIDVQRVLSGINDVDRTVEKSHLVEYDHMVAAALMSVDIWSTNLNSQIANPCLLHGVTCIDVGFAILSRPVNNILAQILTSLSRIVVKYRIDCNKRTNFSVFYFSQLFYQAVE